MRPGSVIGSQQSFLCALEADVISPEALQTTTPSPIRPASSSVDIFRLAEEEEADAAQSTRGRLRTQSVPAALDLAAWVAAAEALAAESGAGLARERAGDVSAALEARGAARGRGERR